MSEKDFETWKAVEQKGAEKLKKAMDALEGKRQEDFKKLHSEYVAFLEKVAKTTGIDEAKLDIRFLDVCYEQ